MADGKGTLRGRGRSKRLLLNILLLMTTLGMILSGLVLQLEFHRAGHGGHDRAIHGPTQEQLQYERVRGIDPDRRAWGFAYSSWSSIHRLCIVLFSLLAAYHVGAHLPWYARLMGRKRVRRNKFTIVLSALLVPTAVTGFIPWYLDLAGGPIPSRILLIEIHDKLGCSSPCSWCSTCGRA